MRSRGRLQDSPRGFGDLDSNPVAGDQRNL
jgi:hypothetical protein